jgi:octaprenyl-diphosphate synthase
MSHGDAATQARLRTAIELGDVTALPDVLAAIHAARSLQYSEQRANEYAAAAGRALDGLPDSPHARALRGLARHAVNRVN